MGKILRSLSFNLVRTVVPPTHSFNLFYPNPNVPVLSPNFSTGVPIWSSIET